MKLATVVGSRGRLVGASEMAECLPTPSKVDGQEAKIRQKPLVDKKEEIEESLRRLKNQGKYVKLNVGGSLYFTTLGTLTKHDNMLRAMFSGRLELETDDEGMSDYVVYSVAPALESQIHIPLC